MRRAAEVTHGHPISLLERLTDVNPQPHCPNSDAENIKDVCHKVFSEDIKSLLIYQADEVPICFDLGINIEDPDIQISELDVNEIPDNILADIMVNFTQENTHH